MKKDVLNTHGHPFFYFRHNRNNILIFVHYQVNVFMNKSYRFFYLFFTCILLSACTTVPNELKLAEQLMETSPDSSLHILQKVNPRYLYHNSDKAFYALLLSQAQDKNDIGNESDSLISIATNYYKENEPEQAAYAWFYRSRIANNRGDAKARADALLKSKEFLYRTENHSLKGLVFGETGNMYKNQLDYDSSIVYHLLAYNEFIQVDDVRNSILGLINVANCYLNCSQKDSALVYLQKSEVLSNLTDDTILISTVYRNLGNTYLMKKDYRSAIDAFKKVPLTHQPLLDSNKWFLLANAYNKAGMYSMADQNLLMVTELGEMAPQYYRLKQAISKQSGDILMALNYAEKARLATDSLQKRKLDISFAGLEKKYNYQKLQLSNQKLIIKDKQQRIWLLTITIILFAGIILVLLWNNKVKNKQLKLDRELLEKEKENNLLLEKQLQFQKILLLNVENYRRQSIKRPADVYNSMTPTENPAFYEELIACMDIQYNNISQRLQNLYSSLTNHDILICCLLLAGFENGMIATILDIKNDSIRVHRTRLRKKLKLQNSESIVGFLRQF